MEKKYYTSKEVAVLLNRSIKTITAQAPKYADMLIGGRWLWTAENVKTYRTKLRKRRTPKDAV